MRLLDLFCGGGGCTRGYQMAGFEVIGVDIHPQPRYIGDGFILGDALDILRRLIWGLAIEDNNGRLWELADFAVIHASPPCQVYSVTSHLSNGTHPDLVEPVRDMLKETGLPYVIENVPGAPLVNPLMLCGSMFGLRVYRHRLFECNPVIWFPPATCQHWGKASGNKAVKANKRTTPNLADFDILTVTGHDFILADARVAMGINWMGQKAISQAIPPAYTHWLGRQMIAALELK